MSGRSIDNALKVLIPVALDLDTLDEDEFTSNRMASFLNLLIGSRYAFDDNIHHDYDAGWIELDSQTIKRRLGDRDYVKILKKLEDHGIIEISNSYSNFPYHKKKSYCKGYRLTQKYSGKTKWITIFDQTLANRSQQAFKNGLKKFKEVLITELKPFASHDDHDLPDNFYINHLSKEIKASHDYVMECYQHVTFDHDVDQAMVDLTDDEFNRWNWCVNVIRREKTEAWHKSSQKTARYYSPICACPEDLRQFIKLNGDDTTETDIKTAQFYTLLIIYNELIDYEQDPKRLRELRREKRSFVKVLDEDFYDWINAQLKEPYPNRKMIKQPCFEQILYGVPSQQRELFAIFNKHFPILASHIQRLYYSQPKIPSKSQNAPSDMFVHAKGNSRFACLQQAREAAIMAKVILQLKQEGIICQQVHDSLIVPSKYKTKTKRLLAKACLAATGVKAKIEFK